MANHYPCVTAEWVGRGWNTGVEGGGHWAAALAQVGGAEVIHFKGKINDTINPCLGHCRGGRGRIHTRCWLPRACSTHTHKSVNMHTHTQRHTQLLYTQTHFPVGHLICQVSIWPQVVMKLEAVARILVAGSYMMKLLF